MLTHSVSAEALKFAGLDYLVKKKQFTFGNKNHNDNSHATIIIPEIEVAGYFATMRTDAEQVLGVVGKDYGIVQCADNGILTISAPAYI